MAWAPRSALLSTASSPMGSPLQALTQSTTNQGGAVWRKTQYKIACELRFAAADN